MRLTSHLDVPWPTEQERAQWWAQAPRVLDETVIGDDGHLRAEGEVTPLRLIHGEHGHPGAVYLLITPNLTRGEAAAQITGDQDARIVRLDYLESADPQRRAWVAVHSVERFSTLTSQSTLEHLAWNLTVDADAATPVAVSLTLDWVAVEVQATRGFDGPDRSDTGPSGTAPAPGLDVEVDIRLRGIWWWLLTPLLWVSRPLLRRAFDRGLRGLVREVRSADATPVQHESVAAAEPSGGTTRLEVTDADLDLRWLRSPISMLFKVRALASSDLARERAGTVPPT